MKPQWYVFYTYPKAEKVVNNILLHMKYESFLPMRGTIRTWKNRQTKKIYTPLFPGYIFVRADERTLYDILQVPKVCSLIKFGNKPCFIPDEDIDGIKRMVELEYDISVEHCLNEGEYVRITQGALAGFQGILVQKKGKCRFGIQLKGINQTVNVNVNASYIEKI